MKIVVVGGSGLIGTRVVAALQASGHTAVAASRATGVNSFTGEGLAEVLEGATTIVDVSNSSYFDEAGALEFFETSTLNLVTYGAAAGVTHHVALSVVGTDRLAQSEGGYFRAKLKQEQLVRTSSVPFSIVHATQFFEFIRSIGRDATSGGVVRLAQAFIQPMAADDVAAAVLQTVLGAPLNGMAEFAGPDQYRLEDLIRIEMDNRDDERDVVADPLARYFGSKLSERELLPSGDATIAPTHFSDWLLAGDSASRGDRSAV